jgi:CheY-like chemotaxis protein
MKTRRVDAAGLRREVHLFIVILIVTRAEFLQMFTVLIADDDRNIREYCRRELEDEGYRVVAARDGEEAFRLAEETCPDVVILDLSMPGIDGLETLARIRSAQPDLPLVLFTSFYDVCVRDERSGAATACVEKCADLAELKRTVAAALQTRR